MARCYAPPPPCFSHLVWALEGLFAYTSGNRIGEGSGRGRVFVHRFVQRAHARIMCLVKTTFQGLTPTTWEIGIGGGREFVWQCSCPGLHPRLHLWSFSRSLSSWLFRLHT